MKRNFVLVAGLLILVLLAYNSVQKILTFRGTSDIVEREEEKLARLRQENEVLKNEYAYKQSERFIEEEIRNKLGLAKDNEQVFVVTGDEEVNNYESKEQKNEENWKKWRKLLLGKT